MGTTPESANTLAQSLIRLMKLMQCARQEAPRVHPAVDPIAYPLLFNLKDEALRVSELADRCFSDVSTVSRQVSNLVGHGLVAKQADPEDRRAHVLTLTDAGRELLGQVHEQRGVLFQRILGDGWNEDDASRCTAYLQRLGDSIENARGSSRQTGTQESA